MWFQFWAAIRFFGVVPQYPQGLASSSSCRLEMVSRMKSPHRTGYSGNRGTRVDSSRPFGVFCSILNRTRN